MVEISRQKIPEQDFEDVVAALKLTGVLMVEISRQRNPEQDCEDVVAALELSGVSERLLGLEFGLEGTISYIPSAGSPPQASLGSPVHGIKHWLVVKGDGVGTKLFPHSQ